MKEIHVEHWVQAKEGRNVELKRIIPHVLGDGVHTITELVKLLMGSCKEFFLQVQPNFVSDLKLVWNPMLIIALLVLSIGFSKNVLDLLAHVLSPLNESGGFVSLILNMKRVCLCGGKK